MNIQLSKCSPKAFYLVDTLTFLSHGFKADEGFVVLLCTSFQLVVLVVIWGYMLVICLHNYDMLVIWILNFSTWASAKLSYMNTCWFTSFWSLIICKLSLQNIIEPSEDIFIQDMDMFDEHLVLFLNKEGSSSICSVDMRTIINCEV